jgi:hypothetical protein
MSTRKKRQNTIVGTTAEITQSFLFSDQNLCFAGGVIFLKAGFGLCFDFLATFVTDYSKYQPRYYNKTFIKPSEIRDFKEMTILNLTKKDLYFSIRTIT